MSNEEQKKKEALIKEAYLQKVLAAYKADTNSKDLSQSEKVLLQQAFAKEAKIAQLLEQAKSLQEEMEEKQKQLQLLDQQVVFERGQMSGVIDALLALKPEE